MIAPTSYPKSAARKARKSAERTDVEGRCVCGDVVIVLAFPAFWAWHDHSSATRHAHGAAYATYVGSWKSRVRVRRAKRSSPVSRMWRPGPQGCSVSAAARPSSTNTHARSNGSICRARCSRGAPGASRAITSGLPRPPNGNIVASHWHHGRAFQG